MIGETIREFEILSELGSGGYGAVYRAHDTSVDRDVAIKVILPQYANQPEFVENFEAEARLIAQLEHKDIVPLYSYWRDETGAYLVMRYIRGGTLRGMLAKQGALPLARTLRIIEQIADALNTAHESDVVHRDLKPDNVLIDERGNAYLTDFGIAKQLSDDNASATDAIKGTFAYLSPEQIQQTQVAPQTDVYALGVMLFEMLAGQHPFHETSVGMMLMKHLREPLPDVRELRDDLSGDLNDIIQKATAKDPAERYNSTLELVNELKAVIDAVAVSLPQPVALTRKKPNTTDERNRYAMIDNVRRFWVEGVLENSLHHSAQIELDLKSTMGQVATPWDTLVRMPEGDERLVHQSVTDVFDRSNGKLLILGDPGSGKTTTLLTLAHNLLNRAAADEAHPIPIVLNLSSWGQRQQSLAEWIVAELNRLYQVPRKVGSSWVESDKLLLLLDGLDEVGEGRRAACVQAINTYRGDHGFVDVVVCSRIADYETLDAQLLMNGAVVIQPLNRPQIKAYFDALGSQVAPIVALLDEDNALYELCQSPLMLSVIALTYSKKMSAPLVGTDVETLRQNILNAYVDKQLERHNQSAAYSRTYILQQLHWLAKQMQSHRQSTFKIDGLQPTWGDQAVMARFIWQYRLTLIIFWSLPLGSTSLIGAPLSQQTLLSLLNRTVTGAVPATLLTTRRYNSFLAIAIVAIVGALLAVTRTSMWSEVLVTGVGLAAIYWALIIFLARNGYAPDVIQPIENLRFSWKRVRLIPTFLLAVVLTLNAVNPGIDPAPTSNENLILAFLLSFPLAIAAILWTTGLTSDRVEQSMQPNQGIWNSAGTGLRVGGVIGGLVGLNMFIAQLVVNDLTTAVIESSPIFVILFSTFSIAFGFAPVIQHITLRRILTRQYHLPWDYAAFLNYASRMVLLRRIGGVYIFPHRYLLEYFADLEMDSSSKN